MPRITMLRAALFFGAAIVVGIAGATVACNDTGTCPATANVQPGGSCDSDDLQCAYTLSTPSAACDGTSTTIATSCVCSHGTWTCPSPYACEAGGGEGGPGDDGGDAASGDDGGDAASGDDGGDAANDVGADGG
jgi:hypothetical protein